MSPTSRESPRKPARQRRTPPAPDTRSGNVFAPAHGRVHPSAEATRPGPQAGLWRRLVAWLRDRDTWILINATGWMLVALYLVLFGLV